MISSRDELQFYIKADLMMNCGYFAPPVATRLKRLFVHDYIMEYLVSMRKTAFAMNTGGFRKHPLAIFSFLKWKRLGVKLGFSIGYNSLGYGVVIPHYGTIVVGESNHIGNYAVLHTSVCVSNNGKTIGDGFYCATGAKITTRCTIGDFVSVGANSVVNMNVPDHVLVAGMPAKVIKNAEPWYIRDGDLYRKRVEMIESMRLQQDYNP